MSRVACSARFTTMEHRFGSFVRASGRGEATWAGERNDPTVA